MSKRGNIFYFYALKHNSAITLTMTEVNTERLAVKIRRLIMLFIIALCLSGMTAFPLLQEVSWLHNNILPSAPSFARTWINKVYEGIKTVNTSYPFMSYGTDWLAFAHLVIAIAFIGPYREPVKNSWVIQFGRIACVMVFPLAFICGAVRGIPFWWQLIDCSFGVFGLIILTFVYRDIKKLEALSVIDKH
jgi:hypothetical protein